MFPPTRDRDVENFQYYTQPINQNNHNIHHYYDDVPPPLSEFNNNDSFEDEQWIGSLAQNVRLPSQMQRNNTESQLTSSVAAETIKTAPSQKSNSVRKQPLLKVKAISEPEEVEPEKNIRYNTKTKDVLESILKSILNNPNQQQALFSPTPRQTLVTLLTNPSRLKQFVSCLVLKMPELSPAVITRYELLILLLKKINQKQFQIKQDKQDFHLVFNTKELKEKDEQISRLKKAIETKDSDIKELSKEYESVIANIKQTICSLAKKNMQNSQHKDSSISQIHPDRETGGHMGASMPPSSHFQDSGTNAPLGSRSITFTKKRRN